jgi:hypothetical protein
MVASGSLTLFLERRALGRGAQATLARKPHGAAEGCSEALLRGSHLEGVLVRVHAVREEDAHHLDAERRELGSHLLGAGVARLVAIESDVDAHGAREREGLAELVGEAAHAVRGGDVAKARRPEGQHVEE